MRNAAIAAALVIIASPIVAAGQEQAPACAAVNDALTGEMAPWAQKTAIKAAVRSGDLSSARIEPGKAVAADLAPTPDVRYVVRPEQPGGSVSKGGLFELRIDQPGRYAVAISTAAWIDVLDGRKAVTSAAHGRGPACSTIRKMVDFDLRRGRYVVQIAANPDPKISMLVVKRP